MTTIYSCTQLSPRASRVGQHNKNPHIKPESFKSHKQSTWTRFGTTSTLLIFCTTGFTCYWPGFFLFADFLKRAICCIIAFILVVIWLSLRYPTRQPEQLCNWTPQNLPLVWRQLCEESRIQLRTRLRLVAPESFCVTLLQLFLVMILFFLS